MLNSFSYKSGKGTIYTNCRICILRHRDTHNLALVLVDDKYKHLRTLTTSVKSLPDNVIAVKNYGENENEGIEDFLKRIGIIEEQPLTKILAIPYYLITPKGMACLKEWKEQQNY